jgi:hypothetical protein
MLEPVREMVSQTGQVGSMKKKRSAKAQIKVITDPKKLAWLQAEIEKRKTMQSRPTHRSTSVPRIDK